MSKIRKMVSNPTVSDVHVIRPLGNFAQKYLQDLQNFVSLRAMPNLPVQNKSDQYWKFSRADFYRDEAEEVADGHEAPKGGFTLSQDSYLCKVHKFAKDITDQQRVNADSQVRLEESSSEYVALKLMIRREALFLTRFFGASIWTGQTDQTGVASAPSTNQFLQWDVSSSTPIKDLRNAATAVQGKTGFRPNKLLLARTVWNKLLDNSDLLSRINGGATAGMPAMVQRQLVASLLELDEILVADGVVNSAKEGATESTAFMAGKSALLYYAPNAVDVQGTPSAGVQFSWSGLTGSTPSGFRIKRFRDEKVESDTIEGQMAFDYKVTGPELGAFFASAIA
jgi:hypothetical protein